MDQAVLQGILDNAVAQGEAPAVVAAVSGPGGTLVQASAGDVTPKTVFWIASMTKPITSVAALQLVEQGKLSLDAPIKGILPELADCQILKGGVLRPAAKQITLRHLLTHTSGFSYPFASKALTAWQKTIPHPPAPGTRDWLKLPLLFEPGEKWEYGVSTDWVGLAVEAASGLSLDAYFAQNILAPLGMKQTGFMPPEERATLYYRAPDGSLRPQTQQPAKQPDYFSGGGGLYSTLTDYLKFLRIFLNEGAGIISPASLAALKTNQIGTLRAGALPSANPDFANAADAGQGVHTGWTLGFLYFPTQGPAGRSAGSLAWAGAANTYFWIDPALNLAAVILMQILPSGDAGALKTLIRFERAVYAALR